MITMMLSGTLARQPEQRTSKNGNSFAVATVRVQTAEGDLYASVTAFGDLAPTLAGLAKGDPVTIIGNGKVTTYQGKQGDTKAGLSVTASRIMALVDQPSAPRPKSTGPRRRLADTPAVPPDLPPLSTYPEPFQDQVPF